MREEARERGDRDAPHIAVVGVSVDAVCGVRDYAAVLTDALRAQGVSASSHWLDREQASARGARREVARFTRELAAELRASPPDAVLLHYSVFAYAYRGVPVFAGPVVRAARASHAPVISLLHEIAYPFRHRGWRARSWAITQRLAMIGIMRRSAAVIVTADFRAEWLATRRWLAKRPTSLVPVHSALPPSTGAERRAAAPPRLGLFGYSAQGTIASVVVEALALLRRSRSDAELVLLGAPGRDSPAGEEWFGLAREHGVADAVSFTGRLEPQPLSDELAAVDVLLFADVGGPSSRKSSLAAALASGRPLVALDGVRTWEEIRRAQAALIVEPTAQGLADAVGELLEDPGAQASLGERGRLFAQQSMSAASGAREIIELCARVGAIRTRAR